MADMIVAGAGTTAVNGKYVENGTYCGKPKYKHNSAEIYIYFDQFNFWWAIGDDPEGGGDDDV